MAKVKVYKFELYDRETDPTIEQVTLSSRMATREGVAMMTGRVIESTEIEIDESQLESGLPWTPKDFTP